MIEQWVTCKRHHVTHPSAKCRALSDTGDLKSGVPKNVGLLPDLGAYFSVEPVITSNCRKRMRFTVLDLAPDNSAV
jgi:hypothetical protein